MIEKKIELRLLFIARRHTIGRLDEANAWPVPLEKFDHSALERQIAVCQYAGVVPLHVLYYLYSGVALALGIVRHVASGAPAP